jgi:hypothetical protein
MNKLRANPGNPEISKYHFKTEREESCTAQLNLRVPPSLLEKIKQQENWQEFVRSALVEKLEAKSV